MRALGLNCTLKRSPDESNTAAQAQVVLDALAERVWRLTRSGVVDHVVEPGIVSEGVSEADEWPAAAFEGRRATPATRLPGRAGRTGTRLSPAAAVPGFESVTPLDPCTA